MLAAAKGRLKMVEALTLDLGASVRPRDRVRGMNAALHAVAFCADQALCIDILEVLCEVDEPAVVHASDRGKTTQAAIPVAATNLTSTSCARNLSRQSHQSHVCGGSGQ
jgi:hypothetical protein